jgi:hypothetical protein
VINREVYNKTGKNWYNILANKVEISEMDVE